MLFLAALYLPVMQLAEIDTRVILPRIIMVAHCRMELVLLGVAIARERIGPEQKPENQNGGKH